MAVCLPVLVLFVTASIDAANALCMRHAVVQAAFEACQIASAVGGTHEAAHLRAVETLQTYEINGAEITISPAIDERTSPRTTIVVTVSAPLATNSMVLGPIFRDRIVTKSITMSRL
jgi:hypothetical protein